jgi:uncharacterized protein (TIGR02246 family)
MKSISVIALTICSLVLISCNGGGTTTNKPAANAPTHNAPAAVNHEADVKKFIDDFAAALSKNDAATLDKIFSDDYVLVTQTGDMVTKAQRLDAIKAGDLKFENVVFKIEKVRSFGETAVAIAGSSGKTTNKGKESTANYRVTLVLNKTKDGWRIVSAHLSPMPETAKTDDAAQKDEANKSAEANQPAPK